MKNNDSKKRKSQYNPNRACYLSADGKYYCYDVWDSSGRTKTTLRYEIGKDGLTEELTIMLDEDDHAEDLNDRYEDEQRDPLFDAKVASYRADPDNEDAVNPWDTIADKGSSPDDASAEDEPENPKVTQVRRIIDEECTEAQQDFFFEHFGMGTQLEEMRQAEAERTGKLPSAAAMTNRKNKIIDKVAKSFGTERVKRHKYPGKKKD